MPLHANAKLTSWWQFSWRQFGWQKCAAKICARIAVALNIGDRWQLVKAAALASAGRQRHGTLRVQEPTGRTRDYQSRYRRGVIAEWLAALALILRGYRILDRRYRTCVGEIDLVAVRGRRLVFVEVKHRVTLADAADAITARQRQRIARAAEVWLCRHRAYHSHDLSCDAVLLAPGRWPLHMRDAFPFVMGPLAIGRA